MHSHTLLIVFYAIHIYHIVDMQGDVIQDISDSQMRDRGQI